MDGEAAKCCNVKPSPTVFYQFRHLLPLLPLKGLDHSKTMASQYSVTLNSHVVAFIFIYVLWHPYYPATLLQNKGHLQIQFDKDLIQFPIKRVTLRRVCTEVRTEPWHCTEVRTEPGNFRTVATLLQSEIYSLT